MSSTAALALFLTLGRWGPVSLKGGNIALQGDVVTQADCMQSETPAPPQPFVCCRKWIRNEGCLSAASFLHFPFFAAHKREPRRGKSAVAFAYFGEAKKSNSLDYRATADKASTKGKAID